MKIDLKKGEFSKVLVKAEERERKEELLYQRQKDHKRTKGKNTKRENQKKKSNKMTKGKSTRGKGPTLEYQTKNKKKEYQIHTYHIIDI
jgi:uncharacterized membrane-anchored protein